MIKIFRCANSIENGNNVKLFFDFPEFLLLIENIMDECCYAPSYLDSAGLFPKPLRASMQDEIHNIQKAVFSKRRNILAPSRMPDKQKNTVKNRFEELDYKLKNN
jgi:hypothetical protein